MEKKEEEKKNANKIVNLNLLQQWKKLFFVFSDSGFTNSTINRIGSIYEYIHFTIN